MRSKSPSTSHSAVKLALTFAVAGAVAGAIAGAMMFGSTRYNATTGNYGWGRIAPVVGLICAILGLVSSFLISTLRYTKNRAPSKGSSVQTESDALNTAEWENPDNWFVGIFYHSDLDSRIIVPRTMGFGYTINLGHPTGVIIGIALLVAIVGVVTYGIIMSS